jgi:DNA ligase-1
LYTRTGHLIPAPAAFVDGLPPDLMLDGELFIDRGKFQEVCGLARTLVSEPRKWKPVRC